MVALEQEMEQPDKSERKQQTEVLVGLLFAFMNEQQLEHDEAALAFDSGIKEICRIVEDNPLPYIDEVLRRHQAGIYISAHETALLGPHVVSFHPNFGNTPMPYAVWTQFGDDSATLAGLGRTVDENRKALEQAGFVVSGKF